MKVILDTNVLISGVYFGGYPYRILEAWNNNKITLIVSKDILDEYERTGKILAEQYPLINFEPILKFITANSVIVKTKKLDQNICDDPNDDKFIACALSAGCKIIISGDKHLLKVTGFKGISILKPREFVELYLMPGKKK